MINGWNMNREVMLSVPTDLGWTELTAYDDDRLAAGDTFLAAECEERLVLRQYGEVVQTWSIYDRPADGLRPMLTPHFRAGLIEKHAGLVISEDDPSWSDWLDYANALTFATHQHERLEV
jgi:hypothetical protein